LITYRFHNHTVIYNRSLHSVKGGSPWPESMRP
jgi:hypothetical protein